MNKYSKKKYSLFYLQKNYTLAHSRYCAIIMVGGKRFTTHCIANYLCCSILLCM